MSFVQKNLPLIVGITLPFVVVLVLLVAVFVPSLLANPQYDFIFTDEGYNYDRVYRSTYEVVDGKVTEKPVTLHLGEHNRTIVEDRPTLYRYSGEAGTVHEISFVDAATLILDPGPSSPDGYIVEYSYDRSSGFFLIYDSGSSGGYYITKGNARKKVPAIPARGGYYGNGQLKFVGWIK